jgi:hypothetical protein
VLLPFKSRIGAVYLINIPNNSLDFEDEKRTLKFQLEWYYLGYLNFEEKCMEYIENSDVYCLV